MKLPTIQRGQRASLPRQGLGPAIQQQQNKIGVFAAFTDLANNLAQQKIEADVAEQNAQYGDYVTQVETELANVQTLTPQELRDAGLSEADGISLTDASGNDKEYLLRHEFYPQLINKRMEEGIERYGSGIAHAQTRNAWVNEQRAMQNNYVLRATKQAADDANRLLLVESESRNERDFVAGNYQSIIDRSKTSPAYKGRPDRQQYWVSRAELGRESAKTTRIYATGSSKDIAARQEQVLSEDWRNRYGVSESDALSMAAEGNAYKTRKRKEEIAVITEPYSENMRQMNVKGMQRDLENLKREDYGSRPGEDLDTFENRTLQNQIMAVLSNATRLKAQQFNSARANLESDIDDKLRIAKGGFIEPDDLISAKQNWVQLGNTYALEGKEPPIEYFDSGIKIDRAVQDNFQIQSYLAMPSDEFGVKLSGVQGATTSAGRKQLELMERAQSQRDELLENNPYALARITNMNLGDGALPMAPAFSPDYAFELPARFEAAKALEDHYGREVSLTADHLDSITRAFDTMNPNELVVAMANVNLALGPKNALKYWSDTAEAGYAPYVAGTLAAEGRDEAALSVLAGYQLLKGDETAPRFIIPDETTLDARLTEEMGFAYGTATERLRHQEAIKAVYARLLSQSGDINSDGISNDLYQEALETVLGGKPVTFFGAVQEPPAPGIEEWQVRRFEQAIKQDQNIDALPDVDPSLPKKELLKGLKSGRIVPVASGKRGVWHLYDTKGTSSGQAGGAYVRGAEGGYAELMWDRSVQPVDTRRRQQ